jgi:hypothetical protein
MIIVLIVVLGALVTGAFVALLLHEALLGRLRKRHPDLWELLGAPDRVFDDGGLAGFRAVRRVYAEPTLRDRCAPDVLSLLSTNRKFGRAYLLSAFVALVVVIACFGRVI